MVFPFEFPLSGEDKSVTQTEKPSVLLVDDKPENLLALEGLLEDLDLNIVKATSGNEALGLMLEYDFALALLDVQMPGLNGFETAEVMRSSKRTKRIPIIFLTAISKEKGHVFKAYEAGAVDYLFKPLDPEILLSKVKVFLDLVQAEKVSGKEGQGPQANSKEIERGEQENPATKIRPPRSNRTCQPGGHGGWACQ